MSRFTEMHKHKIDIFHLVFLVEVNYSSVSCLGILSWQPSMLNDWYLNSAVLPLLCTGRLWLHFFLSPAHKSGLRLIHESSMAAQGEPETVCKGWPRGVQHVSHLWHPFWCDVFDFGLLGARNTVMFWGGSRRGPRIWLVAFSMTWN